MPPRRSYKKSTAGCKTCKLRRVKCNEVHPICGNCTKRGTSCSFATDSMAACPPYCTPVPQLGAKEDGKSVGYKGNQDTLRDAATEFIGGHLSSQISLPLTWARGSSRLLEMRLIHHCTSMAYSTMAPMHDDIIQCIWCTEILQLAFQSGPLNPLLDILLGVSAHHLRLLDPVDKGLDLVASAYFDHGLRACNDMLSNIEENSCLLFTSSVLIALQAVISRQEELASGDPYSVPMAWFRALRGVSTIASAGRPWITGSRLGPLLLHAQPAGSMDHAERDLILEELFVELAGASGLEDVEAYEDAVKHLRWVYVSWQKGEEAPSLRRKLLAFPGRVSPTFISLLGMSDPRALVITAHFFGLMRTVDEIWWLRGMAEREILGLLTIVPKDWMGAMEWPIQQI